MSFGINGGSQSLSWQNARDAAAGAMVGMRKIVIAELETPSVFDGYGI